MAEITAKKITAEGRFVVCDGVRVLFALQEGNRGYALACIEAQDAAAMLNSHADLLAACKAISAAIKAEIIVSGVPRVGMTHAVSGPDYFTQYANQLRAAIRKAEGAA